VRLLLLDLGPSLRGGQKQTLLLAAGLSSRGHEVTVGARAGSPLARAVAADRSLRLAPVRAGSEAAPGVLADVARAGRQARPDVVYAGDSRGHGAAVWSRVARRRPLVVHRRLVFTPGRNPLSRLKYGAVARFLAVSGAVAESLLGWGIPADRVVVIPDGLPPEAFVEAAPPLAPPFRLVHVGAFDGHKGQGLAIAMVRELRRRGLDVRLDLLGDGPERSALEKVDPRDGSVTFVGEVDDVSARLSRSHLLLLPSDFEAAPLVLVEAMAAGCPVLAHDVGGTAELVAHGRAGRLVPSLGLEAWADGAGALLADDAERERLVAEGRAVAGGRTLERTVALVEAELLRLATGVPS